MSDSFQLYDGFLPVPKEEFDFPKYIPRSSSSDPLPTLSVQKLPIQNKPIEVQSSSVHSLGGRFENVRVLEMILALLFIPLCCLISLILWSAYYLFNR